MLNLQSGLKILRRHNGAKYDPYYTSNDSVWIFEDEEETTVGASQLGKLNDSGSYGNAIADFLSADANRMEGLNGRENSEVLNKADNLSADDASIKADASRFIPEVTNMVSSMKNNCTDPMKSMYFRSWFPNEHLNRNALFFP